jgi:16S rRNA pseudouridine516 synthase
MMAARGKPVVYLKRISMGTLVLDEKLQKGDYRTLFQEEVAKLLDLAGIRE